MSITEDGGFSFGHEPDIKFRSYQCYEGEGSVKQVQCAKCGETKLEVGQGSYYTVVRCPVCLHEQCIHDG